MPRPDYDGQPWLYARAPARPMRVRARVPLFTYSGDSLSAEKQRRYATWRASKRRLGTQEREAA